LLGTYPNLFSNRSLLSKRVNARASYFTRACPSALISFFVLLYSRHESNEVEHTMRPATMRLISGFLPRHLRARLFMLVLIAVIPAVALILYTARDQRSMAEKHAEENLVRVSQVVNNEHKLLIEATRQMLTVLAHLPALRDHDAARCSEIVRDIAKDYPQYIGLGAFKPNGDRFCGNLTAAGPLNVADRPWFQQTLSTGKFTIGNYQIGRLAKRAVFPLAAPAVDNTGTIRAVALAVVDLEWLKGLVAGPVLPRGSSLTVVDDNGLILAHHPDDHRVGQSIAGTVLDQALRMRRDGLHAVDGIDHVRRLAVFTSLTGEGQSGAVHLILSTPRDEVFAEANRTLRRNLLWLGLVSLAALTAAWFGGEIFIVGDVNNLLQAAQRIAGGDLKARTGPGYASGELGALARSFDEMASSLEAREEEARRAEAKIRENERLAAMGATVASITHEIANPLNGMYTTVQFLEHQIAPPAAPRNDEIRSTLGDLKREIERLHLLLQDLRFLARPGRLHLTSVSLSEIAAEILAMETHNYRERGIITELDFPAFVPPVMADRDKLKQALLNLCKNAVDAMPDGGKLALRGIATGTEVILEVSDTGSGIPDEVNVFELFTTTKPNGLGLGLAIVRQIVAAHGGAISYNSDTSRGTAFRITIPVLAAATGKAA
jgi:signal transduction histidine kinase